MSWNRNQRGDPQNPQKALMAGTREQGDGVSRDQVREVNSVWRRIWVWIFFMFCHYSSIRNQILLKLARKHWFLNLTPEQNFWHSQFILFKKWSWGLSWWPSGKESACQGRRHKFEPWSGKIPHAMEQLSPCARTTESVLQSLEATSPETVWCIYGSLCALEPVHLNKRNHCNEKSTHRE